MRLRHLIALLFILPFLLADSCVKQVFIHFEYELDRCPPRGFELPENVHFAGWELHAVEGKPYCHGYLRYELDEEEKAESSLTDEPTRGAVVYAKLVFGEKCKLDLISSLSCNSRETLEECQKRMPYQGAFRAKMGTARGYTELVAERILIGQKFTPKFPARQNTTIGRAGELEAWCAKQ